LLPMTAKATAWVPERNSLSWSIVVKSSSVMMVFIPHHERNPSQLQTHFMLESSRPFRLTSYWKRLVLYRRAQLRHTGTMTPIPFANSYSQLPARFYSREQPTPVASPVLIRANHGLARLLGIDPDWLASPEAVQVFAG